MFGFKDPKKFRIVRGGSVLAALFWSCSFVRYFSIPSEMDANKKVFGFRVVMKESSKFKKDGD